MKKINFPTSKILLALLLILTFSCDNDEFIGNSEFQLKSVKSDFLFYDNLDSHIVYNPNAKNKIIFNYNNENQIISMKGNLNKYYTLPGVFYYTFNDDILEEVLYLNDTIKSKNSTPDIILPDYNKYIIKNEKIVFQNIIKQSPFKTNIVYTYDYSTDKIIEYQENLISRILYFSNNNLKFVEKFYYNISGDQIKAKDEIRFNNFDDSINLLKGLFYVNGGFYRAFSKNNFREAEIKEYRKQLNGEFTIESIITYNYDYLIDANNIPDIFEYNLIEN